MTKHDCPICKATVDLEYYSPCDQCITQLREHAIVRGWWRWFTFDFLAVK